MLFGKSVNKDPPAISWSLISYQPFPKRQVLDSSKLKDEADDYFEFDINGRKSSKRVENTAGKEEIAHYEQFLLFPQCFKNTRACLGKGYTYFSIFH